MVLKPQPLLTQEAILSSMLKSWRAMMVTNSTSREYGVRVKSILMATCLDSSNNIKSHRFWVLSSRYPLGPWTPLIPTWRREWRLTCCLLVPQSIRMHENRSFIVTRYPWRSLSNSLRQFIAFEWVLIIKWSSVRCSNKMHNLLVHRSIFIALLLVSNPCSTPILSPSSCSILSPTCRCCSLQSPMNISCSYKTSTHVMRHTYKLIPTLSSLSSLNVILVSHYY
jgi:hypothetical protein